MGAILIAVASPHIIFRRVSETTITEHFRLMLGVQQPRLSRQYPSHSFYTIVGYFIATVFEEMGV